MKQILCCCVLITTLQGAIQTKAQFIPEAKMWGATLGINGLSNLGWDLHTGRSSSILFRHYCESHIWRFGFSPYLKRNFATIESGLNSRIDQRSTDKELNLLAGWQKNMKATPRLNPYVGADLFVGLGRTNTYSRSYQVDDDGNEQTNQPWSESETIGAKSRVLGFGPVMGFEYYVATYMSIGCEAFYSIEMSRVGPARTTSTYFDGTTTTTTESETLPSTELCFATQGTALITFSYYFWNTLWNKSLMER